MVRGRAGVGRVARSGGQRFSICVCVCVCALSPTLFLSLFVFAEVLQFLLDICEFFRHLRLESLVGEFR